MGYPIFLAAILGLWWPSGMASAAKACGADEECGSETRPVTVVADPLVTLHSDAGIGILPGYISRDWTVAQPEVTRAILIFHGKLRNAHTYWRTARKAVDASGDAQHTIAIVPQFLADGDIRANDLPTTYLHWNWVNWEGGDNANGPITVSSFEALDAILGRLADRTIFPNLKTVVLAGHSGGAQVVQHYAIVGKGEALLSQIGVHVRYVVANPSSYLYFGQDRPVRPVKPCPLFNHWKYGWLGAPPYAQAMSSHDYELAYVARDVVYLLGTADTDPNQSALDKKCPAERQGAYRYERGTFYFAHVMKRNPTMTTQRLVDVEGVGHNGNAMFTSASGVSVLFDGVPQGK